MNDKQQHQTLRIRRSPEGGVDITVDGVALPSCNDITVYYSEDDDEFRASFGLRVREVDLDAQAVAEVKARLSYSGPLDSKDERESLRCNTTVAALGRYSDFDRKTMDSRMELPDLLAIVERWQGRQ